MTNFFYSDECQMSSFDSNLDNRVSRDISRFRAKRALFSALSIVVVTSELSLAAALLASSLNDDYESMFVLSALSTFILTLDVTVGIRERASCHHATVNALMGIRQQMRAPQSSLLWQEYYGIQGVRKINYIDSVLDICDCKLPSAPVSVELSRA